MTGNGFQELNLLRVQGPAVAFRLGWTPGLKTSGVDAAGCREFNGTSCRNREHLETNYKFGYQLLLLKTPAHQHSARFSVNISMPVMDQLPSHK
jgi:hypothetical protein